MTEINSSITLLNRKPIGIKIIDGEFWFSAFDVGWHLGYTWGSSVNGAVKYLLNDDQKKTIYSNNGKRGNPYKLFINESGLYTLILHNRKKATQKRKEEISEKLVQLRKKYNMADSGNITPEICTPSLPMLPQPLIDPIETVITDFRKTEQSILDLINKSRRTDILEKQLIEANNTNKRLMDELKRATTLNIEIMSSAEIRK